MMSWQKVFNISYDKYILKNDYLTFDHETKII